MNAASPDAAGAIRSALEVPAIVGSAEEADALPVRVLRAIPDLRRLRMSLKDCRNARASAAFYLAYHCGNIREPLEAIADLYRATVPNLESHAPHCSPGIAVASGRVRVGFYSRLWSNHSVGKFFAGLVSGLPRDRFHVTAIRRPRRIDRLLDAIGAVGHPPDVEAVRHVSRPIADNTLDIAGDLEQARSQIAALRLDVLVYADIGMEWSGYFLAFSRLAPVQCVLGGHPITTGLSNIDYYLSSKLAEPEEAQKHYTEKLVLLDGSPAFFSRPHAIGGDSVDVPPRSAFPVPPGARVYLFPHSLFKLRPEFDVILRDILAADTEGWVVLFEQESGWEEALRNRFRRSMGRMAEKVAFTERRSPGDFWGLLQAADAVLDSTHFSGGVTSYEALSFGVPVITLPGQFLRGRQTYALYLCMGVMDCVARTPEEYVRLALRMAKDPVWRAQTRGKILAANHRLYEDPVMAREFEEFLLGAVRARRTEAKAGGLG